MKTKALRMWLLVMVLIASLLIWPTAGAMLQEPPLEEQIEASIERGLDWLVPMQNPDGSWGDPWSCDRVARTGLVVLKLATYAIEHDMDPLDPGYEYFGAIDAGLGYILGNMHTQAISVQPAGDPDGDGDGIGVYFYDCGEWYHPIYNTGIAMMAIAASGGTSGDPTLGDTLQDTVDYMAWAQADQACGLHRGGWRYVADCSSDNSNSGYVTLGLGYAEAAPPWGFGLSVPQFVKDELSIWIDVIQDDVDGDADDGGSWYDPTWDWYPWVNILKTGNLIYEMGLVDDTPDVQRVQDAVDYIERHWGDIGSCGTGWLGHRQAMFTMMKGFESMGIEFVDLDGDGVPEHDWFAEVAQHLVDTQNLDGSWPWDCWGDQILSTAWALLTLEKAVPEFAIPVSVDIKPESCPNPIGLKDRGVLPVAILGAEDLDVTQIDPATLVLVAAEADVYPLRWSLEDVATPFGPLPAEADAYACTTEGPDGYLDLSLKYDAQEVVAALGDVADGDVLYLELRGNLKEEFNGTPIVGQDVIWILAK